MSRLMHQHRRVLRGPIPAMEVKTSAATTRHPVKGIPDVRLKGSRTLDTRGSPGQTLNYKLLPLSAIPAFVGTNLALDIC